MTDRKTAWSAKHVPNQVSSQIQHHCDHLQNPFVNVWDQLLAASYASSWIAFFHLPHAMA